MKKNTRCMPSCFSSSSARWYSRSSSVSPVQRVPLNNLVALRARRHRVDVLVVFERAHILRLVHHQQPVRRCAHHVCRRVCAQVCAERVLDLVDISRSCASICPVVRTLDCSRVSSLRMLVSVCGLKVGLKNTISAPSLMPRVSRYCTRIARPRPSRFAVGRSRRIPSLGHITLSITAWIACSWYGRSWMFPV